MKQIFIFIIFIIFILLFSSCGSKNPTIRNNIKKNISDNLSVGIESYKSGNLESATLFLQQALKDAYSIDSIDDIILVLQSLTEVNLKNENYSLASNYIFQAESLIGMENNNDNNFLIQKTIGKYYEKTAKTQEDYNKSYQYYIKASESAKKDEEKAQAYNNIGTVKIELNQPDEALEWFIKSKNINESKNIYDSLADNYYNIGDIYEKKGNYAESLTNYNLALKNDKISEHLSGIIEDLKRIASVYSRMGNKDVSLEYYNRALNAAVSINDKNQSDQIKRLIDDQSH